MKPFYVKILLLVAIIMIGSVFFIAPIVQDQNYHHFADDRCILCTPNFWNVWSNLLFAVFGVWGLLISNKSNHSLKTNFIWFFIGVLLTGFGSAYYHYAPNNATLFWDRLPMTITFMSFFSVVLALFINDSLGKKTLYPLLLIGISSILFWIFTNDLRFYVLVQFVPIVLLILILIVSNRNKIYKKYFIWIILAYVFAKLLEKYDLQVYEFLHFTMSGHSLKHLVASMAPFIFIVFLINNSTNHESRNA